MLTGIELMLKRMETHPEEFVGVNGGCSKEWYAVVTPVIPYLTDDEREALNTALGKAYRDHFNGQVMKKMAGESVMSERERQYAEDYYGRSLVDHLNGTSASTLGAQVIKARPQALTATMPSAFGAVPLSSQGTVTLTGSSS